MDIACESRSSQVRVERSSIDRLTLAVYGGAKAHGYLPLFFQTAAQNGVQCSGVPD